MGGGSYNFQARVSRSASYSSKSVNQIFEQNEKRQIHESMDPKKALLRESRDSAAHPNSVPIIIGLDVTGSMERVPEMLVKTGLPHMMSKIIESGVPDPQILFLAIGDHMRDYYPLQVGQFESADLELDTWLTRAYLEGGGGGNGGESYALAWYFAANHTVTDSWEKRHKKGFIFTIGDEPVHPEIAKNAITSIMGITPEAAIDTRAILEKARQTYNVYHIHLTETPTGKYPDVQRGWKELMGEHVIILDDHTQIPRVIGEIVLAANREVYLGATHGNPILPESTPRKIRL